MKYIHVYIHLYIRVYTRIRCTHEEIKRNGPESLLCLLFQPNYHRVSAARGNIVRAMAKRRSFNPFVPPEHATETLS